MLKSYKQILFILFLLLSSYCTFSQSNEVINEQGNYSIQNLKNWSVAKDGDKTTIQRKKQLLGYSEGISISVSPSRDMDLSETYNKYVIDDFPNQFEDFVLLDEGNKLLNGVESKWFKFTYREGKYLFKDMVYLLIKRNKLFIIVCVSTPEKYNKYENSFIETVNTFKILEEKERVLPELTNYEKESLKPILGKKMVLYLVNQFGIQALVLPSSNPPILLFNEDFSISYINHSTDEPTLGYWEFEGDKNRFKISMEYGIEYYTIINVNDSGVTFSCVDWDGTESEMEYKFVD